LTLKKLKEARNETPLVKEAFETYFYKPLKLKEKKRREK